MKRAGARYSVRETIGGLTVELTFEVSGESFLAALQDESGFSGISSSGESARLSCEQEFRAAAQPLLDAARKELFRTFHVWSLKYLQAELLPSLDGSSDGGNASNEAQP